jgi:hypothetical protein
MKDVYTRDFIILSLQVRDVGLGVSIAERSVTAENVLIALVKFSQVRPRRNDGMRIEKRVRTPTPLTCRSLCAQRTCGASTCRSATWAVSSASTRFSCRATTARSSSSRRRQAHRRPRCVCVCVCVLETLFLNGCSDDCIPRFLPRRTGPCSHPLASRHRRRRPVVPASSAGRHARAVCCARRRHLGEPLLPARPQAPDGRLRVHAGATGVEGSAK